MIFPGEAVTHPGCQFLQPVSDSALARVTQGFGSRPDPQQIQHGRVV